MAVITTTVFGVLGEWLCCWAVLTPNILAQSHGCDQVLAEGEKRIRNPFSVSNRTPQAGGKIVRVGVIALRTARPLSPSRDYLSSHCSISSGSIHLSYSRLRGLDCPKILGIFYI